MEKLQKILVGVDIDGADAPTQGSRVAVEQALWLADCTGADVELLHSTHRSAEDGPGAPAEPGAGARRELEALCAKRGKPFTLHLSEEPAWIAITRRALAGETDLVVVAKRNEKPERDNRMGSVSLKLVRKCPVPVWVVKPDHDLVHRTILAATDLTAVGDLATEYGAYLAKAESCSLCVVHAWQMPLSVQMASSRVSEEETQEAVRKIVRKAREHVLGVPGVAELGDKASFFFSCDTPSHAILRVVEERDPDLVVMGTISRGGLAGRLVGNTAERLLLALDCSLLTVKPADFVCPLEPAAKRS